MVLVIFSIVWPDHRIDMNLKMIFPFLKSKIYRTSYLQLIGQKCQLRDWKRFMFAEKPGIQGKGHQTVRQSVGSQLNWSGVFATCSMILKRIVQDFATEMKFGLENLQTKIKDLSTALKTRLELNKEDVIQAGYTNFSEFVKWRRQRVRVEFNWYPVKRLLVSLTV